jgi:hypothetical protein
MSLPTVQLMSNFIFINGYRVEVMGYVVLGSFFGPRRYTIHYLQGLRLNDRIESTHNSQPCKQPAISLCNDYIERNRFVSGRENAGYNAPLLFNSQPRCCQLASMFEGAPVSRGMPHCRPRG